MYVMFTWEHARVDDVDSFIISGLDEFLLETFIHAALSITEITVDVQRITAATNMNRKLGCHCVSRRNECDLR